MDKTVKYLEFIKEKIEEDTFKKLEELYKIFLKNEEYIQLNRCIHIFKRGNNNGQSCTTVVKNGEQYCAKHKKVEKSKSVSPFFKKSTLQIDLNAIVSEEEEEESETEQLLEHEEETEIEDEYNKDLEDKDVDVDLDEEDEELDIEEDDLDVEEDEDDVYESD